MRMLWVDICLWCGLWCKGSDFAGCGTIIYVEPMWIATGLQHFMCTFAKQNKLL